MKLFEKKPKMKSTKCPFCKKRFKYEVNTLFALWGKGFVVTCPICKNNVEITKL